jgi:hypothetical protein
MNAYLNVQFKENGRGIDRLVELITAQNPAELFLGGIPLPSPLTFMEASLNAGTRLKQSNGAYSLEANVYSNEGQGISVNMRDFHEHFKVTQRSGSQFLWMPSEASHYPIILDAVRGNEKIQLYFRHTSPARIEPPNPSQVRSVLEYFAKAIEITLNSAYRHVTIPQNIPTLQLGITTFHEVIEKL